MPGTYAPPQQATPARPVPPAAATPSPAPQTAPPGAYGSYPMYGSAAPGYQVYEYELISPYGAQRAPSLGADVLEFDTLDREPRRGRWGAYIAPLGMLAAVAGGVVFATAWNDWDWDEDSYHQQNIGITMMSFGAMAAVTGNLAMAIGSLRTARHIRAAGGTVGRGPAIISILLNLVPFGQIASYFLALKQRRNNARALGQLRRGAAVVPEAAPASQRVIVIAPPSYSPMR